jgi:hypothetical protein
VTSPSPSQLDLRLEAGAEIVEDLVRLVLRGRVRVPDFQRGLKWQAEDVVALFDSLFRGYPVGSILLRKGKADAARLEVGPVVIDAPETQEALWVVDGQQRLTALTAGLARPSVPSTPTDPWVVYFDAKGQAFHSPPQSGDIPSTWAPVARLLDASTLSEWVFHWKHGGDSDLRASVFQAGSRIRQYRIPLYVVETDDEASLRDIFYRINNFGKNLTWDEVHDALFGRPGEQPSTLAELAGELKKLGMGRPDEEQLLSCLISFKGLDVTRNVAEHYRKDRDILSGAAQAALPAIRSALSFLKRHAEIPHLRLLPRSLPLVVLTRFFALYPEPKPRTLTLLTRWTWRSLLGASLYDERTLLRDGVAAIRAEDEEQSAQTLLSLIPKERREPYSLSSRFDARAADSRLALLGLASLRPLDLRNTPIDIAELIERKDVDAFWRIFPGTGPLYQSPANRILIEGEGMGPAGRDLRWLAVTGVLDPEFFLSHGIDPVLLMGGTEDLLRDRQIRIERAVNLLCERLAEWSRTDRPTISYLLHQAEL